MSATLACFASRSWILPLLLLAAHGNAGAQDGATATPASRSAHADRQPIVNAGAGTRFEPELSDDVPPPVRGRSEPGVFADGVRAADSGNPFVLGFVGGAYAPPDVERVDPLLEDAFRQIDGSRPNGESYAFVMFSRRITPQRLQQLAAAGARPIDFHPGYTWKVALRPGAVAAVAALPFVRWIGVARPEQKVHPHLARQLAAAAPDASLEVVISLFDSDLCLESTSEPVGAGVVADPGEAPRAVAPELSPSRAWRSHGWQQRALEARGVDVGFYVPSRRAFRARATPAVVGELARLDFVHFVEAVLPITFADGPSSAMAAADVSRAAGYTGGAGALAGIIDSGCLWAHEAFASHAAYGWDVSSQGTSPFQPFDFHGSMVCGGILADPPAAHAAVRGYAPKLGSSPSARFRVVKHNNSAWPFASILGLMQGTVDDGAGHLSSPVHVYNNSYGSAAGVLPWTGTEDSPLTIDAAVWDHDQVVVFAAHNHGPNPGTLSAEGSSKNALVVGNVPNFHEGDDPGEIANDSGRGPTGDLRWKPNVCAPGDGTISIAHDSTTGYKYWGGGTSMASPHVTGLVAQLVDHYAWLRYEPARIAALLMATADTRNNAELSTPGTTHHNTYGAGRVDSYRANFNDSTVTTFSFDTMPLIPNQGAYGDFPVPVGTTRVVVCLHWIEAPASPGAPKSVVNDLDLFIDAPPVNTTLNSGEYTAHQSAVDNTEIRAIANPTPGTWRWKIFPWSAPKVSRASVAVHLIREPLSPAATLSLTANKPFAKPNEDVSVTADVFTPDYQVQTAYVDTTGNSAATLLASTMPLEDGPVADFLQNAFDPGTSPGLDVTLGNVLHDDHRAVTYLARWTTEGVKTWSVQMRSENLPAKNASATVTVDGTPPVGPSAIGSTTHAPGLWSNNPAVTMTWTQATDALAGVAGYVTAWDHATTTAPTGNVDATGITKTTTLGDAGNWWFHVRAKDNAGNYGAPLHGGPIQIDTAAPMGTAAVNGGAASTTSATMTLNLSFSDAASGLSEMRFRNTGGVYSPWEPYAPTKANWTFTAFGGSSATGTRFISCEVRDVAGNVGSAAASIFYFLPIQYFGAAGTGSMGAPTFVVTGMPGIGKTIGFSVGNTAAPSAQVGYGVSNTTLGGVPLPLDLGFLGAPGNSLLHSWDGVVASGAPGALAFTIPSNPSFVGLKIYFQALLTGDPSGTPIVSTRAAAVTIAGL